MDTTPVEAPSVGAHTGDISAKNAFQCETALIDMLDRAYDYISVGDSLSAILVLGGEVSLLFKSIEDEDGRQQLAKVARAHQIFAALLQDPYSKRAFEKPRGYAGDAVMLDFVYSGAPPAATTPIGRTVYICTARGPMGLSVIYRKKLLAAYIEQTMVTNSAPRILSVASGHLRELEEIDFSSGPYPSAEIVAIDQDKDSCAVAAARHPATNLRVINESIRFLLGKKANTLGKFHFIYAAGLFDYLEQEVARQLVRKLADLIEPGGKLLIANFLPDSVGRAYMELFLDWRLLYRKLKDIVLLGEHPDLVVTNQFSDPHENVGYVEWTKRQGA